MSIRLKTLQWLSRTERYLFCVSSRCLEKTDGELVADTDGLEAEPSSWRRCEFEVFLRREQAEHAVENDPYRKRRPPGVIERVLAREYMRRLIVGRHELSEFDGGRWRVIGQHVVERVPQEYPGADQC